MGSKKKTKFQSEMSKIRAMMVADDRQEAFVHYSLKIINKAKSLKRWPSQPELDAIGVDRNKMRYHYEGTLSRMAEILSQYCPNIASIIEEEQQRIQAEIENKQQVIIERYLEEVEKYHHIPNDEQLKRSGFNKKHVEKLFAGGIEELEAIAKDYFGALGIEITEDNQIDNELIRARLKKNVLNYDRKVITSIGKGFANIEYLMSTLHYCQRNSARLFCLMTKMAIREIDPALRRMHIEGKIDIVFGELQFHKYFHFLNVPIEDKVVEPLAGLSRKTDVSAILASPKQHLDVKPSRKAGFPLLFMTPGAITLPTYSESEVRSSKRARMAEHDHITGVVIAENEGDLFFVRQTQSTSDNKFIDWGMIYSHDMVTVDIVRPTFVMGDLHSKHKHRPTFELWLKLNKGLKSKAIIAHDILDATSCNPHEAGNVLSSMMGALEGTGLTRDEIKELIEDINACRSATEKTYVVDSNHDDMLLRAFKSKLIWKNPSNAVLATFLYSKAMVHEMNRDYTREELLTLLSETSGISPHYIETHFSHLLDKKPLLQTLCEMLGLESGDDLKFLDKTDSLMSGKYQLGKHGDKGINGAKGSISSFARVMSHFIFGHTHTESQRGHVASVGHCEDDPRYARGGFSKWTRSSALVYEESFQQIRSVFGRVRSFKGAYIHPDLKDSLKGFIESQNFTPDADVEIERKIFRYKI